MRPWTKEGQGKMKATLEPEDIKDIAEKVVELILPLLNQNREQVDTILNADEVARLLRKSKGQIYQWVSNSGHGLHDFPFMKAGKSLRFSKRDIIEWMRNNGKDHF